MRKILLIIVVCIFVLIAVSLFLINVSPRYYFLNGSRNGTDIAEEIIQKGHMVDDCFNIIDIDPFPSPSAAEQSELCILIFAERTKDPSACELLMPSSYGLSCVGGASDFRRPCALGNDRSVSGNGIDATLDECVNGSDSVQQNSCCIIAKVRFLTSFNDCSGITENQDMQDQCYDNLAFKNHDPASCTEIIHENLRSACEVQTKALRGNPSICSGCVPAISVEAASAL